MDAVFNGNQDYAVGLERVRCMKSRDTVVFRLRGGLADKKQPCRTLVSRLYAYCRDFRIKTGGNSYEYDSRSDKFEDFLPTVEGHSLYIGNIEEIVVYGSFLQ